jgi:hypothetical protein
MEVTVLISEEVSNMFHTTTQKLFGALAIVGLLWASVGLTLALAGGAPGIGWAAIAGGGGSGTTGGVTLDSVIGQWTASVGGQISSGFLPGAAPAPAARQLQYLPLVLRR